MSTASITQLASPARCASRGSVCTTAAILVTWVVCRSTSCTVCRCRRASEPRPTAPLTRSRKPTSSTSSSTIPTVRCRLCPAGSTELSRVRLSVRRSRTPLLQVCCCGPGGRVMSIYWCTAVAQRAVPRCQLMDVGRVVVLLLTSQSG